jgi:hypothetical protein
MYNIQIIFAHNKQKPINQNYPKKNGQSKRGTKVTNKQTFEKKKPQLQV